MTLRGTGPESYITENTLVYEGKKSTGAQGMLTFQGVGQITALPEIVASPA
jgi:hypothetical protein